MFLKIDTREKELQNKVCYYTSINPSFKDIKIVVENLPLGDAIIYNPLKDEEILIIERKSVNDLLSSIKDGRYEEQSFRLNGSNLQNHNIIYLIEGDINKANMFKDTKSEKQILYSAIFSLNYYKGFSVLRTLSLDETALFLCNCVAKLIKGENTNRKAFYSNRNLKIPEMTSIEIVDVKVVENDDSGIQTANNQKKEYISVVKKVKKENITVDNIDEIMLCQIPGISNVTALALIKTFGSLAGLIDCIKNDENCLKDISYTNEKNQTRKITKTSITNLVKFLLKK
jgi:hypothetical protein